LRYVERHTPKIIIEKDSVSKWDLIYLASGLGIPLAIPDWMVNETTSLWTRDEVTSVELPFLWYRNGIARYLQFLKEQGIILSESDIHTSAGDEFIYTSIYNTVPAHGNGCHRYTLPNGDIPKGIYQFASNPWLPLQEYALSNDVIPTDLKIFWNDKEHPDDRFLKIVPKNEKELRIIRASMPLLGLEETRMLLEEFQVTEEDEPEQYVEDIGAMFCIDHQDHQLNAGWSEDRLTFLVLDECEICECLDRRWRLKIASETALELDDRQKASGDLQDIDRKIASLCRLLDYNDDEIEFLKNGPPDLFADEGSASDEGGFFDFMD
jgi:hypothetical protein